MAPLESFVSEAGLAPGDILLFVATPIVHWHERFIAAVELLLGKGNEPKTYYHAAMYVGNKKIVEAKWPKAHEVNLYLNKSFDVFSLSEPNDRVSVLAAKAAVGKIGEWYDIGYFFTLGLWKSKHEEICSSLVWDCYKDAGKSLALPGKFITPEAVGGSPDLKIKYRYRING